MIFLSSVQLTLAARYCGLLMGIGYGNNRYHSFVSCKGELIQQDINVTNINTTNTLLCFLEHCSLFNIAFTYGYWLVNQSHATSRTARKNGCNRESNTAI